MRTHPRCTFWRIVGRGDLLAARRRDGACVPGQSGRLPTSATASRGASGSAFDVLCAWASRPADSPLAAPFHIFHLKRLEPIVRPAILTHSWATAGLRGADVRPRPAVEHLAPRSSCGTRIG